ncbi:molecular chaperone, partial [Escherichia coli]|nr:molecular chaperone [Escherichia coli]
MKILNFLLFLFTIYFTSTSVASVFGPHESKIIFSEKDGGASYTISNTDKEKVWLVQSWIEDQHEKKTSDFMSLPEITRIESNSQPSIRIIKK